MKKTNIGIILCYLAIYTIWGSTYLAIKWCVETIPPFYLVSLRFFIGGAVFILVTVLTGRLRTFPRGIEILSSVILGTLLLLLGNGLVSWGEQKVDSYLAALIISSTPFCVAFFNFLFFRERLTRVRLAGISLGVLGVGLILYNGNSSLHLNFHLIIILIGFVSWGLATSIGHRLKVHRDNLVNSGMQMLYVGIAAFIISCFLYEPLPVIAGGISARSFAGLVYLTVFGSAAFYAYNYLLSHEPSIRVSSYAIVNPLIAVLLAAFPGKETLPVTLFAGMPVILSGLALMLYGETIISFFTKERNTEAAAEDEEFDSKITEE